MSYSHTYSLSLLFTSHIAPILLIYLLFSFTCTRAFIFHSFAHKHFQIAHMHFFLHFAHLHSHLSPHLHHSWFSMRTFLIGRHDSCEWDQKPHKKHFLDLGLHFSFISQIQFAIHTLGRKYRKIRVKSRN